MLKQKCVKKQRKREQLEAAALATCGYVIKDGASVKDHVSTFLLTQRYRCVYVSHLVHRSCYVLLSWRHLSITELTHLHTLSLRDIQIRETQSDYPKPKTHCICNANQP